MKCLQIQTVNVSAGYLSHALLSLLQYVKRTHIQEIYIYTAELDKVQSTEQTYFHLKQ